MRLEYIRLKNFRAFKEIKLEKIPSLAVFIGANGTGKSTLFSIFSFLQKAMESTVTDAVAEFGDFHEVRSRDTTGPIEIELKFREKPSKPFITYELHIGVDENDNIEIPYERVQYRVGRGGRPWKLLDFANGEGTAVTNEIDKITAQSEKDLKREKQTLKAKDILAIKGLGQFEKFPAIMSLAKLIEGWHISDFHIAEAQTPQKASLSKHLSTNGDNLNNVVNYFYKHYKKEFEDILSRFIESIPGIAEITSEKTVDNRMILKFRDNAFKDSFLSSYVSDGTMKMLAYLLLLHHPEPHQLLCIEEPENQLYPKLLGPLVEDFRTYSDKAQVFVSTHSYDLLNNLEPKEVFILRKSNGYTSIECTNDDSNVSSLVKEGNKLGYLWRSGYFNK